MAIVHKQPYWIYSMGIFVVWGIVFLVHWLAGSPPHPKTLLLIFSGYVIGWLGATIARSVYK
ncbi:MAG: hypothetical protein ACQR33_04835 [Candidatus Saccharibacteria bacterium]